jgi:arylsulfatase A-like enzyme
VVKELEKQGLMDDTIILITGDHGDDLFEPNCTFGHGTTFNGGDQAITFPPSSTSPGSISRSAPADHAHARLRADAARFRQSTAGAAFRGHEPGSADPW